MVKKALLWPPFNVLMSDLGLPDARGSVGFQEMWIGWRSAGTRRKHIERKGKYEVTR